MVLISTSRIFATEASINLGDWLAEVGSKPSLESKTTDIPKTMMIAEIGNKESLLYHDVAKEKWEKNHFFKVISGQKARLTEKINNIKATYSDNDQVLGHLGGLLGSDLVLVLDSGSSTWKLMALSPAGLDEVYSSPSPLGKNTSLSKTLDAKKISDWLTQSLGYNGYILAVRGDVLLVSSAEDVLEKASLGLVIAKKKTSNAVFAKAGATKEIIEKISMSGGYGIFKSISKTKKTHTMQAGDLILLK
jgi:hypothetical protein